MSVRRAQPSRRTPSRHSERSRPAEVKTRTRSSYSLAEFALHERTLPGRRFVEFPLVQGKIADKVQLFTATNYHSLTIDFKDQTSLHLDIEPGFTVNAQFMRLKKGELETLAEWPTIHISSEGP